MTPTETSATPRLPLSRERILRAAVRLADEGGLEALSMRRLAQALGVQAMSLYNHVAGKDDLRNGIVDLVLAEIEAPRPGGDWKAELRRAAVSAHEVLLRHRWAASLMMTTSSVSSDRLEWTEAVLRTLREAGFSAELTHHAYHALDSHVTGFTLWQVNLPFSSAEELVGLARGFLEELPAERYPYVVEHIHQHLDPASPDGATEFEFGLDLILDGLERLRDAG